MASADEGVRAVLAAVVGDEDVVEYLLGALLAEELEPSVEAVAEVTGPFLQEHGVDEARTAPAAAFHRGEDSHTWAVQTWAVAGGGG